jgi:hypothetical protein
MLFRRGAIEDGSVTSTAENQKGFAILDREALSNLVEPSGIEPLTSTMPSADDDNHSNGLPSQKPAKQGTDDQ